MIGSQQSLSNRWRYLLQLQKDVIALDRNVYEHFHDFISCFCDHLLEATDLEQQKFKAWIAEAYKMWGKALQQLEHRLLMASQYACKNKADSNTHAKDKEYDLSPPKGKCKDSWEDQIFTEANCAPPSGISMCVVKIQEVRWWSELPFQNLSRIDCNLYGQSIFGPPCAEKEATQDKKAIIQMKGKAIATDLEGNRKSLVSAPTDSSADNALTGVNTEYEKEVQDQKKNKASSKGQFIKFSNTVQPVAAGKRTTVQKVTDKLFSRRSLQSQFQTFLFNSSNDPNHFGQKQGQGCSKLKDQNIDNRSTPSEQMTIKFEGKATHTKILVAPDQSKIPTNIQANEVAKIDQEKQMKKANDSSKEEEYPFGKIRKKQKRH